MIEVMKCLSGPARKLALIGSIVAFISACSGSPTPEIAVGIDGCSSCGMVIDRANQAAGWVAGGEFVPFCSPACLLAEYDALRSSGQSTPATIFFADYGSGAFSPASATTFLLTSHVPTVMNARVICFDSAEEADRARQHDDEIVTDWTGYRVRRGKPDTVIETVFGPDGMKPEVVVAALGDVVLWRVSGTTGREDLMWVIEGYPEIVPPVLSPGNGPVELRFLASRPGAGFPIEDRAGRPLGMLKVSGAHTADEAAQ